jgi:hypothetical protein
MDTDAGRQCVRKWTGLLRSGKLHAAGMVCASIVDDGTVDAAGSERDRLAPSPSWLLPVDQQAAAAAVTMEDGDKRSLLHGLLAPNQQSETELRAVAALIEEAVAGFIGQAALATFTRQLSLSLQSLHSFDSLAIVLTKVCEPAQSAWITHDRNREDPADIEFFRVATDDSQR